MPRPPRISPAFFKAHVHGNDYLVFEEGDGPVLTAALVQRICDRHRGPGGDGIVVVEAGPDEEGPSLRMFNPDGGEFERSGNGLRIAGVYLRRRARMGDAPFSVVVGGDRVRLLVAGPDSRGVWDARADMGKVEFPAGPPFVGAGWVGDGGRVVLELPAVPGGGGSPVEVVAVSVGNPHAVAFRDAWSPAEVAHYGPLIGTHTAFPRGTNVQFAETPARREVAIRIWERGVGPTSASGTSACAAVAAAVKRGLMPPGPATVAMEGGSLEVEVAADWTVRLSGPVEEVCVGELAPGLAEGISLRSSPV
ncbi:MAG: diaminopimelate epimerase [Gemmatimonadota bacterium]|nr:diaminopimelate epimerase [Gemmatimonadota bacterium]